MSLNESTVELAALEWFEALGYPHAQLINSGNSNASETKV
jgi:hypothetical protein